MPGTTPFIEMSSTGIFICLLNTSALIALYMQVYSLVYYNIKSLQHVLVKKYKVYANFYFYLQTRLVNAKR